jgi:hypothetical protein
MKEHAGIGVVDYRGGNPVIALAEQKPGVNSPYSQDVLGQKIALNEALAGSKVLGQGYEKGPGGGLRAIPGGPADPRVAEELAKAKEKDKPMPAALVKLQNESLDAMGLAGGINTDLDAAMNMIKGGELKLGPFANKMNEGRNYLGQSTPESRNYAEFMSMLEKMRNDSLRLNKGVQTEGDAVRAWNEIAKNYNDPEVVMKQLARIKSTNERAAELHRLQINAMRKEAGVDPFDFGQLKAVTEKKSLDSVPSNVGGRRGAPQGVDPTIWEHMTPDEKALFQ